jgi:anti-anti-sigma factor
MKDLEIIPRVDNSGVLILKIVGFVDASNINIFNRRIHEAMENGYSRIILDFSELQYINSSALGVLLDAHSLATKRQGDLKILNLPREIEKTFEILGFTSYFQIFSDEKKAIQSFSLKEKKGTQFH